MLWPSIGSPLALCLLAAFHAVPAAASSSALKTETGAANRYVVLDTTSDSPSWSAVLMAMEASADPSNDFTFLGVLATESPDLETFNMLMEVTSMSKCLNLVSSEEQDLYPVDGYTVEDAPDTVKQLVEWVNAYPQQVTIYASSSLSTIAYAQAIDPEFGSKVAELVIVATLDNSNDFESSGYVGFYENTPFIKDQDAFLATMSGDIPLFRIMGPLQPTLSGPEIATRVHDAITADTPSSEGEPPSLGDRPFASAYLSGHMARLMAGHQQAILMQEPAMAVLVDPRLATGEIDVEFTFEHPDDETSTQEKSPMLMLHKLAEKDIDPADRATLIYGFDEGKFWDLLVHTRSRDWKGFCEEPSMDRTRMNTAHDEL